MAKALSYIAILFFFLTANLAVSQDIGFAGDTELEAFKATSGGANRFSFFFETAHRYNENSAYDWLDAVAVYIRNAEESKDSVNLRRYKLIQAQIYYDLGDYDKSVALANELYTSMDDVDINFKRLLLNLIDANYGELKLFEKQIDIRKEKRALGITEGIAFYDIYSNLGLHRQAMNEYIMDQKKNIDNSDLYGLARYNNTVGKYLLLDKSAAVALSNFKQAKGYVEIYLNDLNKVKTENDILGANLLKGVIEGNIGKAHVELKQYEEALPYLENSLGIIRENSKGYYSEEAVENHLALIESHLQLGNLEKAKEYLDMNIPMGKPQYQLKYNRLASLYYADMGNFEREAFYLRKNIRLRDSLELGNNAIQKQQFVAVVAQEDLENSRRMIDEQKQEMEKARKDMQAKDERINLVFISLIFTLLGFAGLVYAYLKSIKNQRLIAEQKHIIENSLVEKDSLLKEIHHRVKNNLQMVSSLLSLQTKNTRSKAAIEALEEGKSRVKAMALIHQKLYQNDDLSVIEMQGYIESLVNSVQSVFKKGGHNINITIDAEGVELDIDRAIPFGLVLNELVSNSFKYAFPEDDENGKIYIHLRKNGEQGYFEYTDNGIGLPEDSEERVNSSMGIRLINRLVNQLQSTLNIDKTSEGVRFWFNFS